MVYVTSGIRWAMALWCAAAAAILITSAMQGVAPVVLGLIAVGAAGPLAVGTALTRFRAEARTASEVLHDDAAKH